jgi:hypothetical protein
VLSENSEMLALASAIGCQEVERDGLFIIVRRSVSSASV